jgi:amino acid transporter
MKHPLGIEDSMFWNQLFAKKSLQTLLEEMKGENRLRRILGPVGLTSLGVGAIIGAGIFVMTGRVAANDAGPAIMLSFCVAGVGCALAALCYAEFASMAPVAGSAYTYAYATLGELLAWIIGWDLILEYAMSCATVAASWSKYLNEFLVIITNGWKVPDYLCHDPFSTPGAWFNLPAVCILVVVTIVLVIGIRESAAFNTAMVVIKLAVVLFVIVVGYSYISKANWFGIPEQDRKTETQIQVSKVADDMAKDEHALLNATRDWAKLRFDKGAETLIVEFAHGEKGTLAVSDNNDIEELAKTIRRQALAVYLLDRVHVVNQQLLEEGKINQDQADARTAEAEKEWKEYLPQTPQEKERAAAIVSEAEKRAEKKVTAKWGLLGTIGLNRWLVPIDDAVRGPFFPYGLSGLMLGAAIVFFAFIGFDSISTHAEEARRPQRDVPIAILSSLILCTVLYIAMAATISGMEPYPKINEDAAVAAAFRQRAEAEQGSPVLRASAGLIAAGALAGMTSVLLITFLSQARIFLAMARDRLLPPNIFGAVHHRFRTPHLSTMLTGTVICLVGAFTPINVLEEMVNIGTLLAFVIVCGAVLLLRIKQPDAQRPFRCPLLYAVAPLGIVVNLIMMLFLPVETWLRLVVWLVIGLVIYFGYSYWNSVVGKQLRATRAEAA